MSRPALDSAPALDLDEVDPDDLPLFPDDVAGPCSICQTRPRLGHPTLCVECELIEVPC